VDVVKYENSSILEVKPHGVSKGNAATAICEALLCDREKERMVLYGERQNLPFHRSITAPVVSLQNERPLPPPPFRQGESGGDGVFFLAVGDDRSDEDMFVAVQGRQWREQKVRVTRLAEQAGIRRGVTAAGAEEKEQARSRRSTTAILSGGAITSPKASSPERPPVADTDEDSDVFTVCVGMKPSAAHYYLEDEKAVVKMLQTLAAEGVHKLGEASTATEGMRRRRKKHLSRSLGEGVIS
jgi:hypothetical protein